MLRHTLALALIVLDLAAPAARPSTHVAPTRRGFSGIESSSVYVTMRDGVKLAADVHLPKGLAPGERTATILHMSRYYRSVDVRTMWKPIFGGLYPITERDIRDAFVKAGYSWVDVDVRGAGASFGHSEYPLSPDEVKDGADLIDWIVDQPWASGDVGAAGSSYDGALALMLLRNHHPALKAVAPRFSAWDMYNDVFLPGGVQATAMLHDWARLVTALDRGRLTDVFGWTAGVMTGGVRPVDAHVLAAAFNDHNANVDIERLLGSFTYRDAMDYRGPVVTMDDFSPHGVADVGAVPIYSYAGYFDAALPRGQARAYLAHRGHGSRLRLGPWFHGGEFNASPYANGRKHDFDHAAELIRFFDYHLRGIDNGFSREQPVAYYTMGEERWHEAPTWPPPGAVDRTLFLSSNHTLEEQPVRLNADTTSEDVEAADRYQVDPTTTTGAGSRWGLIVGTGAQRGYGDQRDRDRSRFLYTTAPLAADVTVTGHPIVDFFVDSNAADGALFGYLEDVWPNGEVRYVTEGDLRLIHRAVGTSPLAGDPVPFHSFLLADARPMIPGETTEVTFDLLPTSYLFKAGHAIRLALAGADAGIFAEIPAASPQHPAPRPPVYSFHRDRAHASRLVLPTYK